MAAKEASLTEIDLCEATEYYKTDRGSAPHGPTSFLFSRQASLANWDAFDRAEVLLTQPMCVVVGDRPGAFGSYRAGFEIYGRAASKDKNSSSRALYDQPKPVAVALEHLIPFYRKSL